MYNLNFRLYNIPLWVSLNAFDLTFKILIDGTTLDAVGEIGVQSNQPLWGAYIDESCYVSAESGGASSITNYASLFEATMFTQTLVDIPFIYDYDSKN